MPLESRSLATKLYRPRITRDLVPRPRLLERPHASQDRKLTLISAPAGHGKSALVNRWVEVCVIARAPGCRRTRTAMT